MLMERLLHSPLPSVLRFEVSCTQYVLGSITYAHLKTGRDPIS